MKQAFLLLAMLIGLRWPTLAQQVPPSHHVRYSVPGAPIQALQSKIREWAVRTQSEGIKAVQIDEPGRMLVRVTSAGIAGFTKSPAEKAPVRLVYIVTAVLKSDSAFITMDGVRVGSMNSELTNQIEAQIEAVKMAPEGQARRYQEQYVADLIASSQQSFLQTEAELRATLTGR